MHVLRTIFGEHKRFLLSAFALALFMVSIPSLAHTESKANNCDEIEEKIHELYLPDKNWKIVELNSLTLDEKSYWISSHKGQCPGISKFFESFEGFYYAVAQVRRMNHSLFERVTVIEVSSGGAKRTLNILYGKVPRPAVVERARPGIYEDTSTGKRTKVTKGFYVEQIDAGSELFYSTKSGHYRRIAAEN